MCKNLSSSEWWNSPVRNELHFDECKFPFCRIYCCFNENGQSAQIESDRNKRLTFHDYCRNRSRVCCGFCFFSVCVFFASSVNLIDEMRREFNVRWVCCEPIIFDTSQTCFRLFKLSNLISGEIFSKPVAFLLLLRFHSFIQSVYSFSKHFSTKQQQKKRHRSKIVNVTKSGWMSNDSNK